MKENETQEYLSFTTTRGDGKREAEQLLYYGFTNACVGRGKVC